MEIKKVALTIGIAVLFALFVGFFIDAVYESPEYDDFCKKGFYERPIPLGSKEMCPEVNYNSPAFVDCNNKKGVINYDYDDKGCPVNPTCDTCNLNYEEANNIYSRNLFFIVAVIGIIAILSGLVWIKMDAIASGFMFGGILLLIYGTVRVFGDLSKIMRVIVLGIELIVLVYIGVKKIRK